MPYTLHKLRQQAIDVLESAAFVLHEPINWSKGSVARDDDGRPVWTHAKEASRWCVAGAIHAAVYDLRYSQVVASEASRALQAVQPGVVLFNDQEARNSKTMAKLLERAADFLREEQLA